jgi:hypothetical protein
LLGSFCISFRLPKAHQDRSICRPRRSSKPLSGHSRGRFPSRRPDPHRGHDAETTVAAAERNYEWYVARAREASLKGDSVEAENSYQHAEHYLRVMRANRAKAD